MKFKVSGSNRVTAARMTMEFDAPNRAVAERKAIEAGMNVGHLEQIAEGEEQPKRVSHRGEGGGGFGKKLLLLLILVVVIVGVVMYWGKIRAMMHH